MWIERYELGIHKILLRLLIGCSKPHHPHHQLPLSCSSPQIPLLLFSYIIRCYTQPLQTNCYILFPK
ncbi:hypothetical protein RJT34_29124 [Clitoria ternatea]|uniref:Uncharacterized protein n=1 Tax=Clitoria ternatea TaxID=43366 RepID=A0AAN9IAR3_CLITE